LKERTTYKIIDPHGGRARNAMVLGKPAVATRWRNAIESLGYPMNKEQLDSMYHRFTALADTKKGCNDEIAALAREIAGDKRAAGARRLVGQASPAAGALVGAKLQISNAFENIVVARRGLVSKLLEARRDGSGKEVPAYTVEFSEDCWVGCDSQNRIAPT
jgi:hypothetical protein